MRLFSVGIVFEVQKAHRDLYPPVHVNSWRISGLAIDPESSHFLLTAQ